MIWIIGFAILMLGLVAVLNAFFPGMLGNEDRQIGLTYNVILLALLGSSAVLAYRGRAGTALKHALAWVAIAALLVLAYSFRDQVGALYGRLGGELLPSSPIVTADGEVELRASTDGHFQADATVDGARVRLLVDTGATVLALAPGDAERIGFDLSALRFDQPVRTANGRTLVARVRLNSVEIGPIRLDDVAAMVHRDGLDQSLLGMNVLDRLSGFERSGDRLILKP